VSSAALHDSPLDRTQLEERWLAEPWIAPPETKVARETEVMKVVTSQLRGEQ
jgi:hypothetical protein